MIKTPHWPIPLGHKPIDLGLERMHKIMERLGNPHLRLPPTIHIAGTNGKGSTLAIIKSILETAGYKVHRYTSPHLVHFNERIELRGKPIDDDTLNNALEACRLQSDGITLTFFEATTAAAILAFSQIPADYLLLETGLGGRLDATNILKKPLMTILTPVSFDHMEFLGDTIAKIAEEKTYIMRRGVPCIVAPQLPEAMEVITRQAERFSAPLTFTDDVVLPCPPALQGEHQLINAKTALKAIKLLRKSDITPSHIISGLKTVKWPARLQKLNIDNKEIWLDGGHNEDAGKALAQWAGNHAPITLICGMLKRKDIAAFLTPLKVHTSNLIAIPIPDTPDALAPEAIAAFAGNLGFNVTTAANIKEALTATHNLQPATILIAGSLYLAGSVLAEAE